ncbi:TatD family hydrolase [Hutsoniella sourekii]
MKFTNNYKPIPICDSHLHLGASHSLADYLANQQILSLINCQNKNEWILNHSLFEETDAPVFFSYGNHPWEADEIDQHPLKYFQEADVIGEIGLDLPWTDLDLDVQLRSFHKQLALAHQLDKPVILHTKGYEDLILDIIHDYPNRYYVHWFSSSNLITLKSYLDFGVYLSVGPDITSNPAVQQVAKQTPSNRLLIESDGLDAIIWAQSHTSQPLDEASFYQQAMRSNLNALAKIRQVAPDQLVSQLHKNLSEFIGQY